MMDLVLLLGAEADVQAAFNRLEEVQEGRGLLFLGSVEAAIGLLRQHPEAGPDTKALIAGSFSRSFPSACFTNFNPSGSY